MTQTIEQLKFVKERDINILSDAVWADCVRIIDHVNRATQDMAYYYLVTGAFANELCIKIKLEMV